MEACCWANVDGVSAGWCAAGVALHGVGSRAGRWVSASAAGVALHVANAEGSHSGGAVGVDLHEVEHVQDVVEQVKLLSWRRRGDCDGQTELERPRCYTLEMRRADLLSGSRGQQLGLDVQLAREQCGVGNVILEEEAPIPVVPGCVVHSDGQSRKSIGDRLGFSSCFTAPALGCKLAVQHALALPSDGRMWRADWAGSGHRVGRCGSALRDWLLLVVRFVI